MLLWSLRMHVPQQPSAILPQLPMQAFPLTSPISCHHILNSELICEHIKVGTSLFWWVHLFLRFLLSCVFGPIIMIPFTYLL